MLFSETHKKENDDNQPKMNNNNDDRKENDVQIPIKEESSDSFESDADSDANSDEIQVFDDVEEGEENEDNLVTYKSPGYPLRSPIQWTQISDDDEPDDNNVKAEDFVNNEEDLERETARSELSMIKTGCLWALTFLIVFTAIGVTVALVSKPVYNMETIRYGNKLKMNLTSTHCCVKENKECKGTCGRAGDCALEVNVGWDYANLLSSVQNLWIFATADCTYYWQTGDPLTIAGSEDCHYKLKNVNCTLAVHGSGSVLNGCFGAPDHHIAIIACISTSNLKDYTSRAGFPFHLCNATQGICVYTNDVYIKCNLFLFFFFFFYFLLLSFSKKNSKIFNFI
jgi:hypothetical protein